MQSITEHQHTDWDLAEQRKPKDVSDCNCSILCKTWY